MFFHYLKVAFRNLWKYKTQSVISILGLAVGFTCFALAGLWIRYEMSYDHFHSKADRIYKVQNWDKKTQMHVNSGHFFSLASELKSNFPEIEEACVVANETHYFSGDSFPETRVKAIGADPAFFRIFDFPEHIEWPVYYEDEAPQLMPCMITDRFAEKYFSGENPIGKELKRREKRYRIIQVIKAWPENTNIPFDIITPVTQYANRLSYDIYVLLRSGTNVHSFQNKLFEFRKKEFTINDYPLGVISLKTKNILYPAYSRKVTYSQIQLFAVSGLLVVLCAIFNYMILYMSRIKIRGHELALRRVTGATNKNLFSLLSVDFFILILAATLTGIILQLMVIPAFKEFANIAIPSILILWYGLIFIFSLVLLIFGSIVFPLILLQGKKALTHSVSSKSGIKIAFFYKFCVFIQILVALGFMFCISIFIKQIHHLHKINLGYNRNVAMVYMENPENIHILEQLPDIESVIPYLGSSILRKNRFVQAPVNDWEDRNSSDPFWIDIMCVAPGFIDFFEIKLLKGNNFHQEVFNENEYIINEAAAKVFGWKDPVGKTFTLNEVESKIIGVVKDFYVYAPTSEVKPVLIEQAPVTPNNYGKFVAYKFTEEKKDEIEAIVKNTLINFYRKEYPHISADKIYIEYLEDNYQAIFKKENNTLSFLTMNTLVCIIISIFGVYSMITITCTRKQKEIAIRKINGATVRNILSGILKEYLWIFVSAAIVAFPAGYIIMKNWLENYTEKTPLNWWIYISVFVGIFIVTISSVILEVIKVIRENPANVLKSE